MKKWICVPIVALFFIGCSPVQEAHRDLIDQSEKGLRIVEAAVQDRPAALAVVQDCIKNLDVVKKTLTGPPAAPVEYDPKKTAASRKEAESTGTPWYMTIGKVVLTLALAYLGIDQGAKKFPGILSVGRAFTSFVGAVDEAHPEEQVKSYIGNHPIAKAIWDEIPVTGPAGGGGAAPPA